MTKKRYLRKLNAALYKLDKEERKRIVEYYAEMIDDLMEDGKTEAEAIAGLESVETIAARELNECRPSGGKKERRGMPVWLIILGSPLWFTLFIVAFSLAVTLAAVVFSLLIAAVAVEVSFAAAGLCLLFASIPLFAVNFHTALLSLGAALILAALALLLIFPVISLVKNLGKGAGTLFRNIFKRSI